MNIAAFIFYIILYLSSFLGIKKARTTADAFSGIRVRNELRTGVILAEDINILKK